VLTAGGNERSVAYDIVVVAPGSRSHVLPVPGLAERGIVALGFAVGVSMADVPPAMLNACDQHDLPLFTEPRIGHDPGDPDTRPEAGPFLVPNDHRPNRQTRALDPGEEREPQ
jgi:hypothetical protein